MQPHIVAADRNQAERRRCDETEHREHEVDDSAHARIGLRARERLGGHDPPHAEQQMNDVMKDVDGEEAENPSSVDTHRHPTGDEESDDSDEKEYRSEDLDDPLHRASHLRLLSGLP